MNRSQQLPDQQIKKMLFNLTQAVAGAKDEVAASNLLSDLLSFSEAQMIAKRLEIAEELILGKKYSEIQEKWKVSPSTIARISEWLERSGEGYRKAVETTKDINLEEVMAKNTQLNVSQLKKRYPMYYWPEILLQTVIAGANKKQQDNIKRVIRNMEKSKQKSQLFDQIKKIIH